MKKIFDIDKLAEQIERIIREHPNWTSWEISRWLLRDAEGELKE